MVDETRMTPAAPPSPPAPPAGWLEGRRLRAWALHEQGWTGQKIADALGVTAGAVSQWLRRAREGGGPAALRRRPPPGPRPKLTGEQRARVPALLAAGAEAFGFAGGVWTLPRIAAVIAVRLGVRYHPAHLSRVVRSLGWSVQAPAAVATQRDEEAVRAWREERWPALKKGRPRRGAPSSG
jgi:transposase